MNMVTPEEPDPLLLATLPCLPQQSNHSGYIFVSHFTVAINQTICDFGNIVFLLCKKKITKNNRKKFNMAKVANILAYSNKQTGVGLKKCIFWRQYCCSRAECSAPCKHSGKRIDPYQSTSLNTGEGKISQE